MQGIKDVLGIIWKGIQVFKSIIGTLFLFLFLFLIYGAFFTSQTPVVPTGAALIIDPAGFIVESKTKKDTWDIMLEDKTRVIPETLLRDIGLAIEAARNDERITALVLNMDYLYGAGLAQLHYIGDKVEDFKKSGKPVLAYGLGFSNGQYLVASYADEIYMHPNGAVFLTGYGAWPAYYKSALDKIKTKVHVFRSGPYKAYGEPFLRDDMSVEAKEANRALLDTLWGEFTTQISNARGIDAAVFQASYETLGEDLRQVGGDLAQLPVEQGLINGLMTHSQWGAKMAELVGDDGSAEGYTNIHMAQYNLATASGASKSGDKIAVVVVRGEINFGENADGLAGANTIIRQLQEAGKDGDVKAVVLRIDSPGGSLLASELIREQVEALKENGIPVIASMGAVAASGGYWIAAPADEIWAQPTTITGSIGVIGIVPTFVDTLDAIGIHVDGIGTTPLSGDFTPGRPLSPLAGDVLQQSVENSYAQFVDMVANYRGMEAADVDAIGQGRVWSGQAAFEFGLVDSLGSLEDAIAAAASRADLSGYSVRYIEDQPDFAEQMATALFARAGLDLNDTRWRPGALEGVLIRIERAVERLSLLNDPSRVYVLCEMCEVR